MTDFTATVDAYIASWNETDSASRRAGIEQLWTTDATYVDPLASARGHAEIDGIIAAVQAQFPDFRFSRIGAVDAHHDQARFTWGLGPAGEEPIVVGFDVAVATANGQLQQVIGFLDKVPAA